MVLEAGGSPMQQAMRDPSCKQQKSGAIPWFWWSYRVSNKNTHTSQTTATTAEHFSPASSGKIKRRAKVKEGQTERVRGNIDMDANEHVQTLFASISDRRTHMTYRQREEESDMETDQSK